MNKCPKCGNNLISVLEGTTLKFYCTNCGFSMATTYTNPIYEDYTDYEVYLLEGNSINKSNYFLIQSLTNMNMSQIKSLFENTPYLIFKGSAVEVKKLKEKLDSCKIKYKIIPNFIY